MAYSTPVVLSEAVHEQPRSVGLLPFSRQACAEQGYTSYGGQVSARHLFGYTVVEAAEYGRSLLMTCLCVFWWQSSHMGSTVQCGLCVLALLSLLTLPVVRTVASATPGWCTLCPVSGVV